MSLVDHRCHCQDQKCCTGSDPLRATRNVCAMQNENVGDIRVGSKFTDRRALVTADHHPEAASLETKYDTG